MDELLKNCNSIQFNVGDKVRIRQDIGYIAQLKNADPERYSKLVVTNSNNYSIVPEMVGMAGKTATVSSVFRGGSEKSLLGATYKLDIDSGTYYWRHALLEKVEEEKSDSSGSTRFPLKVGDTVTVRRDIAERRDKSGYIWSTVNGRKIKSILVTSCMVSAAGEVGKITSIYSKGEDIVCTLAFSDSTYDGFIWSISCLEEFHDYKAWVEGKSEEKKSPPKKKQPVKKAVKKAIERGEDYYGDSKYEEIDISGTKADFFAYDYKGRKRVFPDIDGFITKIDVTIISGDETGLVYFVKDGKANRVAFDASVGTRFISYDDGTYTVEGKDNIKKWLSWSYNKDKANNVNYAIQHMIDFLGGDK